MKQVRTLPFSRIPDDKKFLNQTKQYNAALSLFIGATGGELYYEDSIYFRKDIQNIWVSEGGNDSWTGSFRQPKATITGANYIANENDIINVMPGSYYAEGVVLKNNVNWMLYPNTEIYNTGGADFMFKIDEPGYKGGIYGNGSIYCTGGIGILKQTGYNSNFELECHIVSGNNLNTALGASEMFYLDYSGHLKVTCDEISMFRDSPSSLLETFYVSSEGGYLDVFCDKLYSNCEVLNGSPNITGGFYANFSCNNILHGNFSSAFVFNLRNMEVNIQSFNIISDGCSFVFNVSNSGSLYVDANNLLCPLEDGAFFAGDFSDLFIDVDNLKGGGIINNFFDDVENPRVYLSAGIWESSGNFTLSVAKQNRFYLKDSLIRNYKDGGTGIKLDNFSISPFTGFYFISNSAISVYGNNSYPIGTGYDLDPSALLVLDLNSCVFSKELPSDLTYSGFYRTNQWTR